MKAASEGRGGFWGITEGGNFGPSQIVHPGTFWIPVCRTDQNEKAGDTTEAMEKWKGEHEEKVKPL